MSTVFDAVQRFYRNVGQAKSEVATGGSDTTVVVDGLKEGGRDSGYMMILKSTDGLAPQGEIEKITAYNPSTHTFTVDQFTAAIEANDRVAFASGRYPLQSVIELVNDALEEDIGELELVDETLATTSGNTEYTLPTGIKAGHIIEVRLETNDEVGDERFRPYHAWDTQPGGAGNQDLLILNAPVDAGLTIQIKYRSKHGYLSALSDSIDRNIDLAMLVAAMAKIQYRYDLRKSSGNARRRITLVNDARGEFLEKREGYEERLRPSDPTAHTPWESIAKQRSNKGRA